MFKKVLIVDDEQLARNRISRFIASLSCDFQVVEAESGIEALEKIESERPDILFLDIEMPGLSGIEMLQQVEDRPFRIVFQTAYDDYAIKAFEENACDYLLKPFNEERFKEAMERVLADIEKEQKLEELESKFRERDGYLERISICMGGKIKVLDLEEVNCFVSRDHYTCVYTSESEFLSDVSLSHLEKRLDPRKFVRCHRNNIIRVDRVQSVGVGENMTVQMPNNMTLPVSRGNRKKVKAFVVV